MKADATRSATIRISETSRDTLTALAGEAHVSLQAMLDRVVEHYRRDRFLDAVNAQFAIVRAQEAEEAR